MYNRVINKKTMPVQHEIKSQLAKLLATEDLIVEHKNVQTAQSVSYTHLRAHET